MLRARTSLISTTFVLLRTCQVVRRINNSGCCHAFTHLEWVGWCYFWSKFRSVLHKRRIRYKYYRIRTCDTWYVVYYMWSSNKCIWGTSTSLIRSPRTLESVYMVQICSNTVWKLCYMSWSMKGSSFIRLAANVLTNKSDHKKQH